MEPMELAIPVAFWRSETKEQLDEFYRGEGILNKRQCRKLWRMLDLQGTPPKSMQIYFKQEELERLAKDWIKDPSMY